MAVVGCGADFPAALRSPGVLGCHFSAAASLRLGALAIGQPPYSPVILGFQAGEATSITVTINPPARQEGDLHAWSCATGAPVRVCIQPGCRHEVTAGARIGLNALRSDGDPVARLPALSGQALPMTCPRGVCTYTGFALFTAPGLYRFEAEAGESAAGTAVAGVEGG